jgi:tRNA pseudouridine38-40 synthase
MTLFDETAQPAPGSQGAAVDPGPQGAAVDRGLQRRLRLTVAYDGSGFHGFAAQPAGIRTVGGTLAAALERVLRLPAPPPLTCAGRTDAGVHAWGQVVHVDVPMDAADDLAGLQRRLTKLLAPAIVVRDVSAAPEGWDARRSACLRRYRYTILNRPLPDPFAHAWAWLVDAPLDLGALRLACDPLIGEHDFSSFCRKPEDGASLVRRVVDAEWVDLPDGFLRFDISASSFCQQMVRSIVGTLVEVGLGHRRAGELAGILRSADRAAAGAVAPPHGLCLWEVRYPPQ